MIYSVRGRLIHVENGLAVIECGGVGYACRTTLSTISAINGMSEAMLYTYLKVAEDSAELFGFATENELNCFKMLLSVSGVGPKAALSILSDTTPDDFALSIAMGDSKAFTRTKGVGPKLAQRIVLELKDRIAKEQESFISSERSSAAVVSGGSAAEAMAALMVLGYTQSEAAACLSKLDRTLPAEELIRLSLIEISKSIK